jgi:hypothetical protein
MKRHTVACRVSFRAGRWAGDGWQAGARLCLLDVLEVLKVPRGDALCAALYTGGDGGDMLCATLHGGCGGWVLVT